MSINKALGCGECGTIGCLYGVRTGIRKLGVEYGDLTLSLLFFEECNILL
jgi:hypothetical protein